MALPREPTTEEAEDLEAAILNEIMEEEGGQANYDEQDIQRVNTDEKYMRRFLLHQQHNKEKALKMAMDVLKWRKENDISSITIDSFPIDYLKAGVLFIHNRDKDGAKMLILQAAKYVKGNFDPEKQKKYLIYFLEKLDREEKGERFTLFFDMKDIGMNNMDMEFIQYLIQVLSDYYPYFLNYIIVFKLPWLMNAVWRVVQGLLPPEASQIIKFLDENNLSDYVRPDQSLKSWGGLDDFVYTYDEKATINESFLNDNIPSSISENGINKIKSFETSSYSPAASLQNISGKSISLNVVPSDEIVFNRCVVGEVAKITIINPMKSAVAFKIKTTCPDVYRLRPSLGILVAGGQQEVIVRLTDTAAADTITRDKFLFMAVHADLADIKLHQRQDIWQLFNKDNQEDVWKLQLRVKVGATERLVTNYELLEKVEKLMKNQESIERRNSWRFWILFVLLMAIFALLFIFMSNTDSRVSNKFTTAIYTQVKSEF